MALLAASVILALCTRLSLGQDCSLEDCEDAHAGEGSVSLVALTQRLVEAAESPEERLERAKPVAWIHVPKCGSSFNNFMIHLPGMCPQVPEDVVITTRTFGDYHNAVFKRKYNVLSPSGACPGAFSHWGKHDGAGPQWETEYKGHAMLMLRQPEQRLLSGYHYGYHSWELPDPPRDELEYAHRVQGCAVKMLTRGGGDEFSSCGGQPAPTQEEVALAIHRIRHDVAFVGFTEQWALSMCLGHQMFGGSCRASDFVDGRVTTERAQEHGPLEPSKALTSVKPPPPYDVSALKGWTDPYDGALHDAALEVFNANLLSFGVSEESCQPCFEEAGVTLQD